MAVRRSYQIGEEINTLDSIPGSLMMKIGKSVAIHKCFTYSRSDKGMDLTRRYISVLLIIDAPS